MNNLFHRLYECSAEIKMRDHIKHRILTFCSVQDCAEDMLLKVFGVLVAQSRLAELTLRMLQYMQHDAGLLRLGEFGSFDLDKLAR